MKYNKQTKEKAKKNNVGPDCIIPLIYGSGVARIFFSRGSNICGLGGSPLVRCRSKDACPESCTIHVEFLSVI